MEDYNTYASGKNKINWQHILITAALVILIDRGVLAWQNSGNTVPKPENNNIITEEDINEEKPPIITEDIITPTDSIIKNFSSPYPLAWQEIWSGKETIDYTLTKASLGKRTAPAQTKKLSGDYYETSEEIFALTLYLEIKTNNWSGSAALCVKPSLRRLISEAGDLLPPNNQDFYSADTKMSCAGPDKAYPDQEVIFVVPENEKEFTLTTGSKSNIFFSVTDSNGSLDIKKAPTSESGD